MPSVVATTTNEMLRRFRMTGMSMIGGERGTAKGSGQLTPPPPPEYSRTPKVWPRGVKRIIGKSTKSKQGASKSALVVCQSTRHVRAQLGLTAQLEGAFTASRSVRARWPSESRTPDLRNTTRRHHLAGM